MRKTILLLLAFFVVSLSIPQTACAWDTTAAKYYPLKVGNSYTFDRIQYLVTCIGNPIGRFKTTITAENVLLNGKRYFEFSSSGSVYVLFNSYWKYQRIDSSTMNVYGYSTIDTKEYLLDSLLANPSNSYKCSRFQTTSPLGIYTISSTVNFFGSSKIQRTFFASPSPTSYTLIEGVGFTGYYNCLDFGDGLYLRGCLINGILYGDTISTDVRQISSEVPDKFILKQNYPNPFNPTTKVNYDLKAAGFVSMKLYNVMGEEMASLVNENQKAGSYEFTFDGMKLPSGVYYYRIETSGFTEVKKMSLVK